MSTPDNNNTMGSTEPLISSFTSFVQNIESETKVLKSLTNIRNHIVSTSSTSEVIDKLSDLESILSRLEKSVELFEDNLDSEIGYLQVTKNNILEKAKQQSIDANTLNEAINSQENVTVNKHKSSQDENINLISTEEFNQVLKSTRNRLTLQQINEAMQFLIKYTSIKSKVTYPRS